MTTTSTPSAPSLAERLLADPDLLDAEAARRSLREFVPLAWPVIQPQPFSSNWHIDVICDHLEACTRREIQRLIINIPPRMMKSRAVSVLWPAWSWLTDPTSQWLFASYASELSIEHSVESRLLIESEGGRREGGTVFERIGYQGVRRLLGQTWEISDDSNLKSKYRNTAGGQRHSTSVTAKATGFGGDFIVADDPHNAVEAESDIQRATVLRWWDQAMSSRSNDPKTAVRVVVMQRLHEDDLTGHLLEKEAGYTHLCLPMEYEPSHPFIWPDDPRERAGELLWPDRIGEPEVEWLRGEQGSYAYAGQYQQRPAPGEGGIYKRDWWQEYEIGENPAPKTIIQSWDMAFKDRDESDFVVGQVWMTDLADRYLLAQVRARLDFVETVRAVKALTKFVEDKGWSKTGEHRIVIEDKANGPAVISSLRRELAGLTARDPKGDKEARAHSTSPQVESGNVYLPVGHIPAPLGYRQTPTEEFIEEHASFPLGSHDDQVDAQTQALTELGAKKGRRRVRSGKYDSDRFKDV
jgi:predicted phage terminase large subunit-like protein